MSDSSPTSARRRERSRSESPEDRSRSRFYWRENTLYLDSPGPAINAPLPSQYPSPSTRNTVSTWRLAGPSEAGLLLEPPVFVGPPSHPLPIWEGIHSSSSREVVSESTPNLDGRVQHPPQPVFHVDNEEVFATSSASREPRPGNPDTMSIDAILNPASPLPQSSDPSTESASSLSSGRDHWCRRYPTDAGGSSTVEKGEQQAVDRMTEEVKGTPYARPPSPRSDHEMELDSQYRRDSLWHERGAERHGPTWYPGDLELEGPEYFDEEDKQEYEPGPSGYCTCEDCLADEDDV